MPPRNCAVGIERVRAEQPQRFVTCARLEIAQFLPLRRREQGLARRACYHHHRGLPSRRRQSFGEKFAPARFVMGENPREHQRIDDLARQIGFVQRDAKRRRPKRGPWLSVGRHRRTTG